MRIRLLAPAALIAALLAGVVLRLGPAGAQQLPRSVTIGSNPAGSISYSLASGLAKTVSEATPIQAVVQPHTGATTHLQLSDKGELDFAIDNAVIDCSPQGEDRLKTAVPGFYPRTVQPGRGDGAVVEDSCVTAFDIRCEACATAVAEGWVSRDG